MQIKIWEVILANRHSIIIRKTLKTTCSNYSWTYSGVQIQLEKGNVDLTTYVANGEWNLIGSGNYKL